MATLLIAATILLGCGTDASPPAEREPGPPSEPARVACPERLLGIASRIRTADLPPDVPVPPAVQLPTIDGDTTVSGDLPVISIGPAPNDLWFDGTRLSDAADLGRHLAAVDRTWTILHPGTPSPDRIRIAADARLPMAALAEILPAVTGARTATLLAHSGERPSTLTCPTSAGAVCTMPLGTPGDLDALAASFTSTCPPMHRMLRAIAGAHATYRPRIVATGIRELIDSPECPCTTLDLDLAEYAALRASGFGRRALLELPIQLPLPPSARTLTVQAWATAHVTPGRRSDGVGP